MADRFPLIVNAVTNKIEEIRSGDNLDLTGNGISVNGSTGSAGQYLKTDGSTILWDNPGDVYLNQTQTLTNKTLETCVISGSLNTLTNIPNSALDNSGITVNGTTIPLGESVITPDNNTTYSVSAVDGLAATEKIIRLTSGGNAGAGVTDDVSIIAGTNVTLSRTNDAITINSSYVDTDTVTRLQSATGGALVSGDVTIAATGSSTVSQTGNTITINSTYVDTITRMRAGTGQIFQSGDFTFLSGGATTLSQSGKDITISSLNTITRVKGGAAGSFQSGDIEITGSGATTVSQAGNTVTVSSIDTDTVTRVRGTTSGTFQAGDITFVASGATSVSQNGNTIEISSVNTDTGALLTAGTGLTLANGTEYSVKNSANFTDNTVVKWDGGNAQFANSIIEDDGSTVTIDGDLVISGTLTTINTTTINVTDNYIELRSGNDLVGADGGITVNRTTNSTGEVLTYISMEWYETGGYWRTYNGSIANRLVTENEVQTLTNKTLISPILTEHLDIPLAKEYRVGNTLVAKNGQLGPNTGAWALGAGVTTSSLTSLGTLTALTVNGIGTFGGDPLSTAGIQLDGSVGRIRVGRNGNVFEAYNGSDNTIRASITGAGAADFTSLTVSGAINANGGIKIGDNDILNIGDSDDLRIYHNGTNSYIDDSAGTGILIFKSNLFSFRNAADNEQIAIFNQDGAIELYYDNGKKFETTSTGASVTGTVVADGFKLGDSDVAYFGDGNDLRIYHDGSDSYITDAGTGDLIINGANLTLLSDTVNINNAANTENLIRAFANGAVNLYYDNSKKFETTSTGATVTGNLASTGDIDIFGELNFATPSSKYIDFYTKDALGSVFSINLRLVNHDSTSFHTAISAIRDSGVTLYYANSAKLTTTLNGATVTGNFEPESDATRNLGSPTKRWANVYSADLQLSNEGSVNDVDGTWGQYTIQEGEEDLFLINRRNGKKYKFVLQEVN